MGTRQNRIGEAVLTSTHKLCFEAKIRKIGIPLYSPVLLYKSGVHRGIYLTNTFSRCRHQNSVILNDALCLATYMYRFDDIDSRRIFLQNECFLLLHVTVSTSTLMCKESILTCIHSYGLQKRSSACLRFLPILSTIRLAK